MATQTPPPYNDSEKNPNQIGVEVRSGEGQEVGFVPPTGQMVFMNPNQQPMMQVVQPNMKPPYPGPPDYLVFALVTMIACAILNITSLLFGIPAILFAVVSRFNRVGSVKNFKNAQSNSNYALGLTIACIIYTLVWAIIIAGLMMYYTSSVRCNVCYTPSRGYYCRSDLYSYIRGRYC